MESRFRDGVGHGAPPQRGRRAAQAQKRPGLSGGSVRRPTLALRENPHATSGEFVYGLTRNGIPSGWSREGLQLKGRWRLFRHEAGRVAGPAPWAYVLLFALSQVTGHWSAANFSAVTVWLSNGIMVAALLQLHRRPAMMVVTACFAINLFSNVLRGDPGILLWVNALMNMSLTWLVAVQTRRFCGAALDMRRPARLVRFAFIAAASVMVVTAAGISILWAIRHPPLPLLLFNAQSLFTVELMGLLLVTPVLLLFARAHRFKSTAPASRLEAMAAMTVMVAVSGAIFWQDQAPLLFLAFLPMLFITLRLSPMLAGTALLIQAAISGVATLTGHGPVNLFDPLPIAGLEAVPDILRRLSIYNAFMLAMVATVLPLSTVMSERRRLESRLRARTLAAQEARRRAEDALAARSRFLAVMSHEMRTPLNGVAGFAGLLAARTDLAPDALRQVRHIRESGDGLLMLVEDILDFARGDDALSPEPLDLAAVARESLTPSRIAADARGLTLIVDDHLPARARFACDRRALRQTLHPLVANAVKFTEAGEIVVRLDHHADGVVIQVSDTGCGIPPEAMPDLFEAFAQGDASIRRRHSGAGLGLALVARHVARMGGRIEVESAPDQGSTFILHLPLERVVDAATETVETRIDLPVVSPVETEAERAPRVLVVDDHPVNREVARIMLQALGCDVVEVIDGVEAIEAVQADVFDLVLMDVRMPRMDGLEATRRIRGLPQGEGLAIVAMTADAMPEDVVRCLAAGMNAHLAKPVSQASLFDAVSRALSGDLPDAGVGRAA
ncbi:MAG: response regulator [Brevundimonas sp.]|nr:MAG: response regulator [Brevundimonas sp.]